MTDPRYEADLMHNFEMGDLRGVLSYNPELGFFAVNLAGIWDFTADRGKDRFTEHYLIDEHGDIMLHRKVFLTSIGAKRRDSLPKNAKVDNIAMLVKEVNDEPDDDE